MQKRPSFFIISLILMLALGLFGWLSDQWRFFADTPLYTTDKTYIYDLAPGVSAKTLAKDLAVMGVLKRPRLFVMLARYEKSARRLQSGEYKITPGLTPKQLLQQMVAGKVIQYKITFVEGWTLQHILQALANDPHLIHNLRHLTMPEIAAKLKIPYQNPEGLFFSRHLSLYR